MRILGAADFADLPWKNGGGRTLQLAIDPPNAAGDRFDWKVNIATIAKSGPFSRYPGYRRSLLLLDGEGFELELGGRKIAVRDPFVPISFDGDEPVDCRLLGGTSRDFGVISRLGRPALIPLRIDGPRKIRVAAGEMIAVLAGAPTLGGKAVQAPALVLAEGETLEFGGKGIAVHTRVGG